MLLLTCEPVIVLKSRPRLMNGMRFTSRPYRFVISPMSWNSTAILKPHSVVVRFARGIGSLGRGAPNVSSDAYRQWFRSLLDSFSQRYMGPEPTELKQERS